MQVNKIQNNQPNLNNKKKFAPNFKALYFATPKIQQEVCGRMDFAELLQKSSIKAVIKKYNLVVTDILTKRTFPFLKKYCNGFKFRACTDVIQDGDSIKAAGMKTPEISNVGVLNFGKDEFLYSLAQESIDREVKYHTFDILENKPYFDFLQFRNDEVKEDFQNNPLMRDFLNNTYIRDAISRYNIVVLEGEPLKFVACTDIAIDKNNEIQPAGFMSHTFERNHGIAKECYKEGYLGAHLDNLLESTGEQPSKINKVKVTPKLKQTNRDDFDSIEE